MVLRYRESAFRHQITEKAIEHAVKFALFADEDFQGEEPPKVLYVGPDQAGNMLEVVGRFRDDGVLSVFHAMVARPSVLRLVNEWKG